MHYHMLSRPHQSTSKECNEVVSTSNIVITSLILRLLLLILEHSRTVSRIQYKDSNVYQVGSEKSIEFLMVLASHHSIEHLILSPLCCIITSTLPIVLIHRKEQWSHECETKTDRFSNRVILKVNGRWPHSNQSSIETLIIEQSSTSILIVKHIDVHNRLIR